jgi:hypothetical protein
MLITSTLKFLLSFSMHFFGLVSHCRQMQSSAANKFIHNMTGKGSAQSVQPPFSTEPTEESTVATPPDQTNDTETITHQQAITPAPETTKTTFQGAYQEAMTPIAGPTSMDPQFAGTLPAEVAHSEQKPTPSGN